MAYPYKKMDEDDFAYIRSVTACDRVWVGDEIAREYYRDEMPEYGVFPPELYVEVINKEEISASWPTPMRIISRWSAGEAVRGWPEGPPASTAASCFP